MKEKGLIIPENCPPVEYLLMGFTRNDVLAVVGIGLLGAVAGIAIYQKNGNTIISLAVTFIMILLAVSGVRRDKYTENLIDKIGVIQKYYKMQKHYEYAYKNIWEMEKWEWMRHQ